MSLWTLLLRLPCRSLSKITRDNTEWVAIFEGLRHFALISVPDGVLKQHDHGSYDCVTKRKLLFNLLLPFFSCHSNSPTHRPGQNRSCHFAVVCRPRNTVYPIKVKSRFLLKVFPSFLIRYELLCVCD